MASKVRQLTVDEAEPCPFCGSNHIVLKEGKTKIIECMGCGIFMFNFRDGVERDVLAAWNERAV